MMGSVLSAEERKRLDTIPKRMQFWSQKHPDRELFVFHKNVGLSDEQRMPYTCRQVLELAGRFAARLRGEFGFKRGDVIANSLPNCPERLFTDLGIILAGCVCLNASILFSDGSDFRVAARNSGLSAIIVYPDESAPAWRLLRQFIVGDTSYPTAALASDEAPAMTSAILVSRRPAENRSPFLQELEESQVEAFVDPDIHPDDIMYIFSTSGTSGYCKLVAKTHKDLIGTWSDIIDRVNEDSCFTMTKAVCYNDRSLGWMGGFPFGTYVNGDTRVLLDVFESQGIKTGAQMWGVMSAERVDYGVIMPLDLDNILKHVARSGTGLHRMKIVGCGGQPITKNQFQSFYAIAEKIFCLYGSTEAGFVSFGYTRETDVKDYFAGHTKPGVYIRIVDEQGRECPPGQTGTIQVKGKDVFTGYFNLVEVPDPKTLKVFTPDGWLDMQDNGYFDVDGNLYVLGRTKDVIMFGASNIVPGWLEAQTMRHPDVQQVCIVPVSDPVLYQNICVIIKLAPGADLDEAKLRAFFEGMFLQDKDMEGTPVPKYYMILDEFPRTGIGKIDRLSLQKMAEKKFGSR